jgi:enoyl-CoA hydratase
MEERPGLVLVERRRDGVGIVTLNNPPLNLQTLDLMSALEEAVRELDEDDAVRSVVLTGSGTRAFSAGSDVKEFPGLRENFVEDKLRRENAVFSRIERMQKPVVAALCGTALGGGCELAISCDMRIIDERATIGFPEINLGSFPGSGGLVRLTKLVGRSRAMELMCLGTVLEASRALRIGLVDRISPHGMALRDACDMAGQLSKRAVFAIRCIKEAVQAASTRTSAEAVEMSLQLSERIFRTADAREGVLAFIERRRPVFEGAPQEQDGR